MSKNNKVNEKKFLAENKELIMDMANLLRKQGEVDEEEFRKLADEVVENHGQETIAEQLRSYKNRYLDNKEEK